MCSRVLTLVSILSLIVCIAIGIIWARSCQSLEAVHFSYRGKALQMWIKAGEMGIDNQPEISAQTEKEERIRKSIAQIPGAGFLAFLPGGERFATPLSQVPPLWTRSSRIPLPTAMTLFALLPTARLIQWKTRRTRASRGLCPKCAYNLTGNLSGVCPECGTVAPNSEVGIFE